MAAKKYKPSLVDDLDEIRIRGDVGFGDAMAPIFGVLAILGTLWYLGVFN